MARIVIIEDEPDLAMGLRDNLEFEGHTVAHGADGQTGLRLVTEHPTDLVLLDIMLPDLDGFEICRRLRAGGYTMPIVILSARGQEIDKVRGLELGADDYVTKPFSLRELLARVHAALRRAAGAPPAAQVRFRIGDREVDLARQVIIAPTGELPLGYYESEILRMLHEQVGEAVPRADMLNRIWGVGVGPADRTVDNHIVSLRRKLEPDPAKPRYILTAHAVGYKLVL
ncbi:MAG TPA: response regulator transcription factor [Phycisphaerae bacterium]|nr:response regulator transcription factor [Phycisphaerae bacterium]HPM23796.1 response regulator transcription factor [Phycisphaerae bacterium]HQL54977.1 response regulator transcription factor [Phycisphaerae bacterium]